MDNQPAIGEPGQVHSQECVQRFKGWQSGKGQYGSPENSEKGPTMRISPGDFLRFKKVLNVDEDEKFPRYSWDTPCSTLIIRCMPSPLHTKVVSTIWRGLNYTCRRLPADVARKIDIVGNQLFAEFHGECEESEKIPDATLQVENAVGSPDVKFVLQAGLSETYGRLVEDARMWLEVRKTVSAVILVKIEESPSYQCQTQKLSGEESRRLVFPMREGVGAPIFTLEHDYGPAVSKGLTWAGKITGFVEIWRRDPKSGLAICTSDRMDLSDSCNLQTKFRLSEFLEVAHEDDCEICFDWEHYLDNLGRYIKELEASGCHRMLRDLEGPVGYQRLPLPIPSPSFHGS
ncbi:unnamed protein product [Tuber aestivum]|uniref:Uncharacterized protein n=1 Tax=Tuber aestivum TaxID=59557 RepID=A0A292PTY9_9PEZI|nr:unnamed protein product [Tuber aestivum]